MPTRVIFLIAASSCTDFSFFILIFRPYQLSKKVQGGDAPPSTAW